MIGVLVPALLERTDDELTLSLAGCRGSEFTDTLAKAKEIVGRKYDGKRKLWCYPPEPQIAERIIHAIQPEADASIVAWISDSRQQFEQELVSPLPDDGELLIPWATQRAPWQPEMVNEEPFVGLKAHQRALVAAIADASEVRALICDDQGLGKTGATLSIVAESAECGFTFEELPKLVICPNSVKGVWKREVERWLGPEEPCVVVDGTTVKAREAQLAEGIEEGAWVIVNYEQLRVEKIEQKTRAGGTKTVTRMKQPLFEKTSWAAVVCDEVHRIKNRKAAQTKGVYKVSAPIMLGLTGTPIQNSPDDLWSPLHWLFPKEYTSYWRFYEQYVDYVEGYFGKDIVGVKNEDALRFELNGRLYRRTKAQVLDLPEKQRITVPVSLDIRTRKLYHEAETRLWLEVETAIQEGDQTAARFAAEAQRGKTVYSIPNGAARTVRLRQILSTPALLGGEDHSPKMDALVENIIDNKHKPHVVFAEFVQSCDILAERLRGAGLVVETYTGETQQRDRAGLEDAFQRREIDVLVGTIGAMREGITLTAADTVHFLERAWVPAWNTQAEDRCHRIGQSNAVTVYIYSATDTVDDGTIYLTNRLKDKIVRTVLPQDAVKES